MQNRFARLQEKLGAENVFVDRASILAFCAYKILSSETENMTLPLAVARPRHAGHIRDIIDFCREENIGIQIRGSGSSGIKAVSSKDALLLLTTGLDRVLDLDTENRTISIQSGLTVNALNAYISKYGLHYPHQTFPNSPATVGGQIAANLPDIHTYKFGSPATLVKEMEVYLSTGDKYILTSQNDQSLSPVLPLAPVFCGSRGLLGLIAGIKIRLLPSPERHCSYMLAFPTWQEAISASNMILASGITPDALEILDSEAASICYGTSAPIIYISLSDRDSINFPGLLSGVSCKQSLMDDEKNRSFLNSLGVWQLRLQSQSKAFLAFRSWIPQSRLSEYLNYMDQISAETGVKTAFSIHAGIAFINILLYSATRERVEQAAQRLFAVELMLNNLMLDEGDALLDRRAWEQLHADNMKLSQALTRCMDPLGMFSSSLF